MNSSLRHLRLVRTSRPIVVVLCIASALALLLATTACSKAEDTDSTQGTQAEDTSSDALMQAEDVLAALEESYGSEPWIGHIEQIDIEQMLLADVVVVSTDLSSDPGESYEFATEIANSVLEVATDSYSNVRVSSVDGIQMAGAAVGGLASDVLDLPSPPANAEMLVSWLDLVFGDSGEEWLDHVVSIEVRADHPGWAGTEVLVVSTDLVNGSTTENQNTARLIGMAIDMSGQTLADNYAVIDSEGANVSTGGIPTASLAY